MECIGGQVQIAVQIILRVYHSPSEVLCGFDVDPCCVGYDGTTVWALPRALAVSAPL